MTRRRDHRPTSSGVRLAHGRAQPQSGLNRGSFDLDCVRTGPGSHRAPNRRVGRSLRLRDDAGCFDVDPRERVSLSSAATGDPAGPALLLLPGPTDSWRSYEPVLEHLPASVRAIVVSQRGHGDSDKPPTGYRVQDFAVDVPMLLDALGIERAVLAGHSGSCLVARRVALDHPERVAGLVLEASPTTLRGHAGLTEFVESVVSILRIRSIRPSPAH